MFRILYPIKDTTIYDRFPELNSGIDQVLELTKQTQGEPYQSVLSEDAAWDQNYNSRILIKFDITPFQTIFSENNITSYNTYLKLFPTEAKTLPIEYTLYSYPLAEDWRNGNGNYNDEPEVNNGASWYYKTNLTTADVWSVSYTNQNTFTTGGGSWHTSSAASQSFSYDDPQITMNVSTIVNQWLSASISNHGFIIKHSEDAEINTDIYGSLKYFSRDTHTIYLPKLILYYSEPTYTGSFTTASLVSGDYVIHAKNLRNSYREFDDVKIRYTIRDMFPEKTYQSASNSYTSKRLPSTSYYSIIDSVTGITIVDFDTIGTKFQADDYGHYIRINFQNFMPERYYKIIYKVVDDNGTRIIDQNHDFKITR